MPRSSARRGQTQPLAALLALVVLGAALAAYGVAFEGAVPDGRDRNRAAPALTRTLADVRTGAVALPDRLAAAAATAAPDGYHLRAELVAGNRTWTAGPQPPAGADAAARVVPVRVGPGRVRTGRLRVVVWR